MCTIKAIYRYSTNTSANTDTMHGIGIKTIYTTAFCIVTFLQFLSPKCTWPEIKANIQFSLVIMLRMCLLLLHHTVTGYCSILSCPWRRRHSYTAFIVRGLWIVQTNLNKYVTFVNTRWTRIPFYTQKSVSTYVSIIRLRISEHIPLRICYEYVVLTSPIATIYWYSVMLHSTQLAPRFYAICLASPAKL